MAKAIVATFDDMQEAHEVVRDLQQCGFTPDDISIIANETAARSAGGATLEDVPITMRDSAAGAPTGAAAGGVFGAGMGLIAGLAGLAIPGIGPIVAAGPLAATLAGAGIGAIAGGLIGALVALGIPKEHADYYAESVRRGGVLVTVQATQERAETAADVMRRHGAIDIERRAAHWRQRGWTRHDPQSEPYTTEQIERERAAYRDAAGQPLRAAGSDATATIGSSTIGGRPLSGGLASGPGVDDMDGWRETETSFRQHHVATYGNAAGYDDYEPAYRYGWESARSDRYQGRAWSAVEPDLRRDWERRYPEGGAWDHFKAAVRNGWERASDAVEHAIPGDSDHDRR